MFSFIWREEFNGVVLSDRWYDHDPNWLEGCKPSCFCPPMVRQVNGILQLWMYYCPEWLPDGYLYGGSAVKTKQSFLYGAFDVLMRGINAGSVSSGLWLYKSEPTKWTEIDLCETWVGYPEYTGKYHGSLYKWLPQPSYSVPVWAALPNPTGWHFYRLEWTPQQIRILLDGRVVGMVNNTYWHQPLQFIMSIQTYTHLPLPDKELFPSCMEVSHVTYYKWI